MTVKDINYFIGGGSEGGKGIDFFVGGGSINKQGIDYLVGDGVLTNYRAPAVNFDGASYFTNPALQSFASTNSYLWSQWFNLSEVVSNFPAMWTMDPVNDLTQGFVFAPPGDGTGAPWHVDSTLNAINGFYTDMQSPTIINLTTWYHVLAAWRWDDTNVFGQTYVNGQLVALPESLANPPPVSPDFTQEMLVGAATHLPPNFFWKGGMADFFFGPGIDVLDSNNQVPESVLRLFISAEGKPVNPATAVAALGTPAVLMSGDALSFGANQGSGGPFTLTGTLTNASSSPSD